MSVSLNVSPSRACFTDEIGITVSGLAKGQPVVIEASLVDDADVTWSARGHFRADARGDVDVRQAPSTAGTYTGVDAAGLLWSMTPQGVDLATFQLEATERAHKLGQPVQDPLQPRVVDFSVKSDGDCLARASLALVRLDSGVEPLEVRDGNLRGMAFRWKDRSRKRGAIMSLTGSGGGVEMNYAPLLASLGYDVFSLAYFAHDDLPPSIIEIPLEYFAEGFEWMRENLGCEKIAVQGASRGGELSALLAATFPDYVDGAMPIVPMFASSPGWNPQEGVDGASWTLEGKPVSFPPSIASPSIDEMIEIGQREPDGYVMTPWYRALMEQPEAKADCAIPVENAGGPILLVSGVEDAMWPSSWGADVLLERLRAEGFQHGASHLALRETGHITPLPNQITTFDKSLVHSLTPMRLACGGNAQGSARNSRLFWNALVAHYRTVFGA